MTEPKRILVSSRDYKNGIKTNEDTFYINNDIQLYIAADGVTMDPDGEDWRNKPKQWRFRNYPKESMARKAADILCKEINNYVKQNLEKPLKDSFVYANKKIKEFNNSFNRKIDYLKEDYYSSIASAIKIKNSSIEYSYVGDCGIAIYSERGDKKFKTDNTARNYDEFLIKNNLEFGNPETRRIIRRDIRNNPNFIINGELIGFGTLSGEEIAVNFISAGKKEIAEGDVIIAYTDGFEHYINTTPLSSFIKEQNWEEPQEVLQLRYDEFMNKQECISQEFAEERTSIILKV